MRTSFSPGLATAAYYIVAVPFTAVLGIAIFVGGSFVSEMLADPTGETSVFSFLKIGVAIVLKLIAGIVPFLLFWPMARLGRKVRTNEQQRRQAARDRAAESLSEAKRAASRGATYEERFVLYLRPFSSTGNVPIPWNLRVVYHKDIPSGRIRVSGTLVLDDLETVLAEALDSRKPRRTGCSGTSGRTDRGGSCSDRRRGLASGVPPARRRR
jgi:hypothetical protein